MGSAIWSGLYYSWRVLASIMSILIILYVFSRLSDQSDTIVIGLLGIIYLTVRVVGQGMYMTFAPMAVAINNEFRNVKKLLGEDIPLPEDYDAAMKKLRRMQVRIMIDGLFFGIIFLICIFNIFTALNR